MTPPMRSGWTCCIRLRCDALFLRTHLLPVGPPLSRRRPPSLSSPRSSLASSPRPSGLHLSPRPRSLPCCRHLHLLRSPASHSPLSSTLLRCSSDAQRNHSALSLAMLAKFKQAREKAGHGSASDTREMMDRLPKTDASSDGSDTPSARLI